ncbi:glycoside hydrolase family 3 C-terminal domain-containing protein [Caldanaerobius polysaccharolyticus]|uniref:glycoside hydrolase family 3 C-terminal domain-containing protein n=1 Tax=Caldanaerobius polysaccharolyticus TaxID=44256 RepID=UPI00047D34B8|nr:glycoside hydrolase family 3 C-terminal domain-containing protein [Caldanaerobius polysaccharolyticus]
MDFPFRDPGLPLDVRVNDLISRLTLDEKIHLIPTRQAAIERLGIKEYHVGGEAAHGLVSRSGAATVFPQPIGLACTWDPELMRQIGSAMGDEARVYYKRDGEKGGLTLWAPTIDMARDPRWGRTEEAYGEDPYLTGKMSAAFVKGLQGDHPFYLKAVATPKHFYGNNNEKNRLWSSSSIDPRNKKEYYLKAFKPAFVEGGAYSLMTAYNAVNGTPCIVNPEVQKIVKEEWGCKGFIVCDGGDMSQTVEYHNYYKTHAETVANAIKNGVDVMTDDPELVVKSIKEALERGLLSEEDLDKALRNILRVRFKLGQFDLKDINPYASIPESVLCSREHAALSLKAAREAIVLLKNENNTLPLSKDKIRKVAVIGPLGDVVYRDWYTGIHPYRITPLQGIKNKLPDRTVVYVDGSDKITLLSLTNHRYISVDKERGLLIANKTEAGERETFTLTDWGWGSFTLKSHANGKYVTTDDKDIMASAEDIWGWYVREIFNFNLEDDGSYTLRTWNGRYVAVSDEDNRLRVSEKAEVAYDAKFKVNVVMNGIDKAVAAAKESDVAIVFVGNHPLINGKEEIDRPDITLAPAQENLVKAVYNANPNTVLVIVGSYPMAVNWANNHIPAILYTAHGSQELGNAIADVLFGDYSPAGRLNMTWYRSIDQLPDIMDYDIIKGKRTYMYFDGEPLYPFGHGLTYTDFRYSDLKLNPDHVGAEGKVTVSVKVENIGSVASDEVVQMYVSAVASRVKRPIKELKGFKRIHLLPGQSQVVRFLLPVSDLAFWDVTRDKFCVESGCYKIMVGRSSADIKLWGTLVVDGETIPHRDLTKITRAENYDDYFGILLDECKEGGTCISHIDDGDWIMFDDVDFGSGVSCFEVRVSSDTEGGVIGLRLDDVDGTVVGICAVPGTGNGQSWTTVKCPVTGAKGIHRVYLKFTGKFKISWFRFMR